MKSSKGKMTVKTAVLALSLSLVTAFSAGAQEYNYHINNFDDPTLCPNPMLPNSAPNVHQLKANYLDLRYNSSTKELTLEAEFSNDRGKLPTGFHFGVSDGPMPQGVGHISKIYFDATNLNNVKVTGYTYNTVSTLCGNARQFNHGGNQHVVTLGSWLVASPLVTSQGSGFVAASNVVPADDIFSSAGQNASFVLEKSASDQVRNGITYRYFRLVLDTTGINNFVPYLPGANAPYTWQGAKFGSKVGLWFWAVNASGVAYNGNGLLSSYNVDSCYICDFDDATTNLSPSCDAVKPSATEIRPGDKITAVITGRDPEKDGLLLTYSGNPSGSNFDKANNSILTPDANGKVDVNFDWVPGINEKGSYKVNVQFTQQYGSDQASITCPFEFSVTGCDPTDWRETINGIDDQIAHQLTNNHVKVLIRRIKSVRGRNTRTEQELKSRAEALGLEAWQTLSSLQRNRVIRQNCGSQTSGCEAIETTKSLNRVNQITNELYGMVETLVPTYRKVLNKSGITGRQNTRRWRGLFNSATNLRDSANVSVASLPATVYACERL
jgi:hypothetical protein